MKRFSALLLAAAMVILMCSAAFGTKALAADVNVGTGTFICDAGGAVVIQDTVRNDVMLVGGVYTIGNYDVRLTMLGYTFCTGNGNVTIYVFDTEDGSEVATATTDSTQGVNGQTLLAALATPVTLKAHKSYYVAIVADAAGWQQTVQINAYSDFVTPTGRAYFDGTNWVVPETSIYNYGGVNFRFEVDYQKTAKNERALITASNIETANGTGIWNDFGSFIGMTIQVGAKDMVVTEIGRMMFAGNTQDHILRIVDAETKTPLVTVSVNMNGQTVGQYVYAKLPYALTLKAGKKYYVLSEEHAQGDMSGNYDYYNSAIQEGALAKVGDDIQLYGVYYLPTGETAGYTEVPTTGAQRAYVGLNLKYGDAPTPETGDNTNIVIPAVLLIASAGVLVLVAKKKFSK